MNLVKNFSIATAAIALSFAAVSVKPAQAASVNFVSNSGNTYTYDLVATLKNETLAKGLQISLAQVEGVTGATFLGTLYNATASDFSDPTNPILFLAAATQKTAKGAVFTNSTFSLTSVYGPDQALGLIQQVKNGKAKTLFTNSVTGPVTAPVPEPITVGGTFLAAGFGMWLKRKKAVSA